MVDQPIIPFIPDHPKGDASKEVPNLGLLSKLFRKSSPKEGLLPIEFVIIACPKPTKLMHDEGDPPPNTPCSNAIPKRAFH